MRVLRMVGLAAMVTMVLGGALVSPAHARVTVYKGQWQCDDRGTVEPLSGMTVQLWKRGIDWLPVELVGSRVDEGFTTSTGRFRLTSAPDDDNYFVRMALRDAHGVRLKDFWGINDWSIDAGQMRNDVPTRVYGGLLFSTPGQSHKCAIWAGVSGAYAEYRREVGSDLPTRGVLIEADAVTAGVPFTPHTSIWWPGGFPVGYGGGGDDSITRHEFGHVIRHGFDGDLGHFLGDVATHNYLQNHLPCNRTGPGFAFNEGWAEYWARDFAPAPDCGRPGDMETEGNVAAALTQLEAACAGNQRRIMVDVLRRNPGTIHSFEEFRTRLGCPVPPPVPPPPPEPEPIAVTISPAQAAALARAEARAASKRIADLQVDLKGALKRAEHTPLCSKAPCAAALKSLTRPAGVQLELDLARIQLKAADDFDTKKEQKQLRAESLRKLLADKAKREAEDRRKATAAALRAAERVLEAARPVFKVDSSKFVKDFRSDLTEAAARFRRALRGGGTLPGGLALSSLAAKLPREVRIIKPQPPIPAPTPTPTPTPTPGPSVDQRSDSALTIDSCPAGVTAPKPIEVAGKLTPAQAGSEVKVTFTHANAGATVVTVQTAADGSWKASHQPGPNDTGAWSVVASFVGDSNRKPANSPTCQTTYN